MMSMLLSGTGLPMWKSTVALSDAFVLTSSSSASPNGDGVFIDMLKVASGVKLKVMPLPPASPCLLAAGVSRGWIGLATSYLHQGWSFPWAGQGGPPGQGGSAG